jgi:hypothetical protein
MTIPTPQEFNLAIKSGPEFLNSRPEHEKLQVLYTSPEFQNLVFRLAENISIPVEIMEVFASVVINIFLTAQIQSEEKVFEKVLRQIESLMEGNV